MVKVVIINKLAIILKAYHEPLIWDISLYVTFNNKGKEI